MAGTFAFGPFSVSVREAFLVSQHTLGLVNFKPVAPGHVLLIPRRKVARFAELNAAEVGDLFAQVQAVGTVVEREYEGESLTITVQDGPAAGQTVAHVHVHVIPRRKGDWANNDDIYPEIEKKEAEMASEMASSTTAAQAGQAGAGEAVKKAVDNEDRPERTLDDMAAEASRLRKFFTQFEDIWA